MVKPTRANAVTVFMITAVSVAALGLGAAGAADQTITGKKLLLKSGKFVLLSKDPSIRPEHQQHGLEPGFRSGLFYHLQRRYRSGNRGAAGCALGRQRRRDSIQIQEPRCAGGAVAGQEREGKERSPQGGRLGRARDDSD